MSSKSSSHDFSMFSLFIAGLACLVPFASAYTQPVGATPKGNPISAPGLNSIVPAGKPYTITWQPTTEGTVTLVLLKGPSTDAGPQYPIAQKVMNTGTYVWKPSTDLAPQNTGYGLQLIVDATGQYQYTTQFGISNPAYKAHSSQSSSSSQSAWTTSSSGSSYHASATSISSGTAPWSQSNYAGHNSTMTPFKPTGWVPHNATIVKPTGTGVPSLKTTTPLITSSSATSPTAAVSSPVPTGSAATVAASFIGLVIAAAVAVLTV